MNRDTAVRLAKVVKQCAIALDAEIPLLKDELSEDEFAAIKRGIARTMTTMDTHIVQHLVVQHPDADPWKRTSG